MNIIISAKLNLRRTIDRLHEEETPELLVPGNWPLQPEIILQAKQ